MTTAPENYYPAEYQGRTIYFCTSFCLETFNADPERFYNAHSKKKDANTRPTLAIENTGERAHNDL